MARMSFSGAMLGRPPLTSASYMAENLTSIFAKQVVYPGADRAQRVVAGTKSSSFTVVNRLSL